MKINNYYERIYKQESEYPSQPVLFDNTVDEIIPEELYIKLDPIFKGERWIAVDDDRYVVLRMYMPIKVQENEDSFQFILEVRKLKSLDEARDFINGYYEDAVNFISSMIF